MQPDLLTRLTAMYSHRGDGIPTQPVNPDGDEAAALLRDCAEVLRLVISYREGSGQYNFSGLPPRDRANATFDAWQGIETRVRALLATLDATPDRGGE